MIFFTKGVIETVKKLNWVPDIIHLHGWFASLFPLYLKKLYSDDPIFDKSKIVSSIYGKSFEGSLSKKLREKIEFDRVEGDLDLISEPNFESLTDLMIKFSDSVILSSENIDKSTAYSIKNHSKDVLDFKDSSDDEKLMEFLLKNID
jgi:starch synthase